VTKRNQVRIVGGRWRNRLIRFAANAHLRPTPDRVRETLFNWLGQTLDAWSCLDLFAGSGALGFEAASRGAADVVMVESNRDSHAALARNAQILDAGNIEIVCKDACAFLAADRRLFDIIFLDPPFQQEALPQLLGMLRRHLAPAGLVYVEAAQIPEIPPDCVIARRSKVGQVNFLLLEFPNHDGAIQ
jgi:16S rRNA (guanine(966)-N(2))-methyltransferase RsmD